MQARAGWPILGRSERRVREWGGPPSVLELGLASEDDAARARPGDPETVIPGIFFLVSGRKPAGSSASDK